MFQNWLELTFVHWEVDATLLQSKLPPGLTVDTMKNKAYLSFVPFTMTGVRATWQPDIPRFSNFHEWNLRTYVRDESGTPGVWFFSLEASNRFAVLTARSWYKLPYHFSRMSLSAKGQERHYTSNRIGPGPPAAACSLKSEVLSSPAPAPEESLDFWLIERYLLFAHARGGLLSGRVHHSPYDVCQARLIELDLDLLRAEGFEELGDPLPLVHYSPGVSVEVFPLKRCE